MKKRYWIGILLVVLCAATWLRLSEDPDAIRSGSEPPRPSPIDDQIRRPTPRIAGETVRTRVAESAERAGAKPVAALGGTNWAVVMAIYKEYEPARRRASDVNRGSTFKASVYPPEGQGAKYMVVLDSGLTQPKAMEVRDRALAEGLPSDTYVTRLGLAP